MTKLVFFLAAVSAVLLPRQLSAQQTADSLRALMRDAGDLRKGELYLELANHYLAENADSTLHYTRVARNTGRIANNPVVVIRSYAMEGEAFQKQSKMKEAIASYFKGLALAEKYKQKSLSGTLYNGIGVCYFYLNDLQKAGKYLELAAAAKKATNDYKYYALISANLGAMQIMGQSYKEAIKTLKEAERTLLQKKQYQYVATVYNSLGAAYQGVKPDSCVYYYKKSLAFSIKNNDDLNVMTAYQNLGDYYLERKMYTEAISYMKTAIARNELRPEDQYKPALFERISAAYDSIKDFSNAYHYKKLETEARQRLFTIDKQKAIEELDVKYQSEKKEKEIQVQKKKAEQAKNQRTIILFAAIFLFLVAGCITYLVFQRKRITQKFEQEKLRFFENILHEIRTPLTLIGAPVQFMKQNPDAPRQEQLGLIERNAKKLAYLVDELLDASKIGKGSYQLHYVAGDVDDFINQVISSFTGEAGTKGISMISKGNTAGTIWSFPSNVLEKILSNLIGNALKYCPAGTEVRINSEVRENKLLLSVADSGPGIPKKEQEKVFRRFYRGRNASGVTGTGIGLSLVKEMVTLVQGNIEMRSDATGTAFLISIPVQEINEAVPQEEKDDSRPVLLLAEDNQDMAALAIAVLKEDFHIIHVRNGQQAMDSIRDNLPDIVLSDIMMPLKEGIGLLKEIRSDEITNHLPVALFSAKASLESRLQGLQQGADAYIAKPFSPEELKLVVRNLFTTVRRNRDAYQESVQSGKAFEERIRSQHAYVNKVIEFVIHHIDDPEYSVNELSGDLFVSRSQLHRKLVALTGFSTTNFIRMIRLEKAKDLLLRNEGNITEIAYKCGFSSQSYFTKSFTEYFGKSPSQFAGNQ